MKNKNINLLWMLLFNFCVVQAQTNTNINFNRVGALHFPISTIDSINYTVNSVVCPTTVSDVDGNIYNVIAIGDQCWTKENLKTTHYMNGGIILNNLTNAQWASALSGACADYNNNAALTTIYGKLYNWYAVTDPGGLCPIGWHVSTNSDWSKMAYFLDPLSDTLNNANLVSRVAAADLRESGTVHWLSSNTATNITGFTALPGGIRFNGSGTYDGINFYSYYWTSTPGGNGAINYLFENRSVLYRTSGSLKLGCSVRCVKD
jgi:uncharacterized protein (TIGR02145 family)